MKLGGRSLSLMAALAFATGQTRSGENYLLELLAWCAFTDRIGCLDREPPLGF